jgi:hypothetical protein
MSGFEKNLIPRVLDLDDQVLRFSLAVYEPERFFEVLPAAPRGTDSEMTFAQCQDLTVNAAQAHLVDKGKRIEAETHEDRTREEDRK